MQFEIFTLFPEVFPSYLNSSILKRAQQNGHIHVNVHNIRDWTHDKHHVTDDNPYGGGGGMIVTDDDALAARMRSLLLQGATALHHWSHRGFSSALQAKRYPRPAPAARRQSG